MNQSQLGPTISKYGLVGGLLLSVQFLLSSVFGFAQSASPALSIVLSLVTLVIFLLLMIFAIRQQRDQLQDGFITLGQCVLVGMGVVMLAGLIQTVVSLVYTNFIDPTFMERTMATIEEKWEEAGMSEEQIEQARKWTLTMKNPVLTAASTLACYGAGGAIIALILGLIMKKEKPEFS